MERLRGDPELKQVFDDIAASGTAGMERHWNDAELMSKISRKMADMGIAPEPAPQPPGKTLPVGRAYTIGSRTAGAHGASSCSACAQHLQHHALQLRGLQVRPTNLHDAAKAGDADATASLLEVSLPCCSGRGCAAAVHTLQQPAHQQSFAVRSPVVDSVQEGCDPNSRDSRGITPLGVAVGFNRLGVVKVTTCWCLQTSEAA
jgi:hypothetical protein